MDFEKSFTLTEQLNSNEKPVKRSRTIMEVPDLLLAYTYFLNKNHTCHLSVGYDNEDFTLKIVIFKNTICQSFRWEDWILLYENMETIETFFSDNYNADFLELPYTNNSARFKMSIRNDKKCLISVQNNKKLILDVQECLKLLHLMPYIHSIALWYNITSSRIEAYYNRYLQICVDNKILKLLPNHFFLIDDQNHNYCNSSRIFNELPILCQYKLSNDLYQHYFNN